VVTQLPKLFEDKVGPGANWFMERVGFGGSDEGRFGGQAFVVEVDLRHSLSHRERGLKDVVRHGETFGGRQKVAESTRRTRRWLWERGT
jgi:hypothetical protein